LPPVFEDPSDFDNFEETLKKLFKEKIYQPIIDEINVPVEDTKLQNSDGDYLSGLIKSGKLRFYRGEFRGKLNAKTSRALKRLGAKWSRKHKAFKLPSKKLPKELLGAIEISESRFQKTISRIKKRINKILPEDIAGFLNEQKLFDETLYKMDYNIDKSLEGITVSPKLTDEGRAKLASEYNNNMQLSIKGWAEKEIKILRKEVQERSTGGARYESLVKIIQKRYDVSLNKAKFLARQETNLMMAKFRETRYRAAGSEGYIWTAVAGSPSHPVRPMHKKLDGKYIKWNNKPITSIRGDKNHAGEDYNCRCFAKAVIRF